jgi:hypothetical protein
MEPYEGMGYPAVEIENTFAKFLGDRIGDRGLSHDADVFRGGHVKTIGKALNRLASQLERRVNNLPGGLPSASSIVNSLRGVASEMEAQPETVKERYDYHWMIVADLVQALDALLEKNGV